MNLYSRTQRARHRESAYPIYIYMYIVYFDLSFGHIFRLYVALGASVKLLLSVICVFFGRFSVCVRFFRDFLFFVRIVFVTSFHADRCKIDMHIDFERQM